MVGDSPDLVKVVQRLLKEYPEDLTLGSVRSEGITKTTQHELMVSFRLCSHFLGEIDGFFNRVFKAAGFASVPIQL